MSIINTIKFGSIEAGGTKFVLVAADENYNVIQRKRIPTTTPKETLSKCLSFFKKHQVSALGIGSFGPIDIDQKSKSYGYILKTPKSNWANTNIVGVLRDALHIPVAFTTDVNASAYGEYVAGHAKDCSSVVYFTIGTGIGGGAIQNDQFIGGLTHPEMGHTLIVPRSDDSFCGICPFHHNYCFEGMASGPAIEARTGNRGENLPRTDPVFDLISYYAAQLAYNTFLQLRPEKIVFGGSVLQDKDLATVRYYFNEFNQGYVITPELNDLIVSTGVSDNGSATIGNLALAKKLLSSN